MLHSWYPIVSELLLSVSINKYIVILHWRYPFIRELLISVSQNKYDALLHSCYTFIKELLLSVSLNKYGVLLHSWYPFVSELLLSVSINKYGHVYCCIHGNFSLENCFFQYHRWRSVALMVPIRLRTVSFSFKNKYGVLLHSWYSFVRDLLLPVSINKYGHVYCCIHGKFSLGNCFFQYHRWWSVALMVPIRLRTVSFSFTKYIWCAIAFMVPLC